LTDLQIRQLKRVLYLAANNPETASEIVKEKIEADTKQTQLLYGFDFKIDNKSVSTNEIDVSLKTENNIKKRLKTWEASKEVGIGLKDGLANLQRLRNKSVQALGYDDFFTYQVSDYGMTVDEMRNVCQNMIKDIWPLYRELHTWARYILAEKYGEDVPEMLPAHWLPNRWGQDWKELVEVEGINFSEELEKKSAEWIVKKGEDFYVSLGFEDLPQTFWENSSLYPAPPDAEYKKNNHASAWHMDFERDVRSLMSVDVKNSDWWSTSLHELGHIYYFLSYSNPDVPYILREGGNRGFHEAFGSMIGLASLQQPFLEEMGLIPKNVKLDDIQVLFKEALEYIIFIPWSAGVMTDFEYELYTLDLPKDQYNFEWWNLKRKYQGIVPPYDRGEQYCDAASKTHINNDAAQYYDYAISYVLLFQFHNYIAKQILHQDPHATNYYGNKKVGEFLSDVMSPGATVDWRELMKTNLGSEMSAKPMVDYFAPLMDYLKKVNEGRTYTLRENF
ncbi:MAG: M2 family metallopeptidase, partial [Bacteroidetes bacterium]|nr:M2 family metallopeptidase [Bacteroidota bacterium]